MVTPENKQARLTTSLENLSLYNADQTPICPGHVKCCRQYHVFSKEVANDN